MFRRRTPVTAGGRAGYGAGRPADAAGDYGPTATERAATAVAGGGLMLVRLVRLVAGIVTAIIALAILFVVLDASTSNTIVSHIRDWAHTLAAPFRGIFHLHSAKGTFALNYGIAIVVYWIVAWVIERLIAAIFAPARRRAVA